MGYLVYGFNLVKKTIKNKLWDIIGFGILSVDDLSLVDSYPEPNSDVRVLQKSRQGGGLTGTALVTASRLGLKCAYAGILGRDEISGWILADLEREGINCEHITRRSDVLPIHSSIIVSRNPPARTIFAYFPDTSVRGLNLDETVLDLLVPQSRLLFVDAQRVESMLYAVKLARKLGIPTVADINVNDHPGIEKLMTEIDHLIVPSKFACEITGKKSPAEAVKSLHRKSYRACTAVTVGENGCWYISRQEPDVVNHQTSFKTQVLDTTGCGDVFHGAYATGMIWGWSVSDCIRLASAAAAIKATKLGGRDGIPDKITVLKFLSKRKSEIA